MKQVLTLGQFLGYKEVGAYGAQCATVIPAPDRVIIYHVTETTNDNKAKRKHTFDKMFQNPANQRSTMRFF